MEYNANMSEDELKKFFLGEDKKPVLALKNHIVQEFISELLKVKSYEQKTAKEES